jgi:flagellar biosynthesis GTPase FlhF
MAKFVKYQNGGVPDDLKNKFESAGYKSNKDGTKFTKGNKVFKLNKDGTYDLVQKGQRKQNIENIAVKTLRGVLDTGTLGISNLLRYNERPRPIRKAKVSDIDQEKVESILTKQKEKEEKKAELKKQREEKQEQKKQQVLANREKRLADKEAEKKALLERKQKVREDYIAQQNAEETARLKAREEEARKKAEAEALRQKQAQEDELKRQQEAERLAPFADDI